MPSVSWFKNHRELAFDLFDTRLFVDEDNSLIIHNVSFKDEAVYSCRASNVRTGKATVRESNIVIHGNY